MGLVSRMLSATLIMLAIAGCQTMTGRTAGAYVDDNTTTAAVKSKLVADRAANLTSVGVNTVNGVVYLTGVVATPEQRLRAEQLAAEVRGVRQIVNNLQYPVPPVVTGGTVVAAAPGSVVRRAVVGTVASVDSTRNQVTVTSGPEQLLLQLPAATVAGIRPGDQITIDVTVRPAR